MLTFTPIASSSAGNAYIVESGGSRLLLDCGIGIKRLRAALMPHGGVTGLSGVLVSHEHSDHAKALPYMLRAGLDCYMSEGTANALGVAGHHRVVIVPVLQQFRIPDSPWTVLPFDTVHDAAEPTGFLISDGNGGKLLFATDTAYIRYRFRNLTHIAIECNYCSAILRGRVLSGAVSRALKRRIIRSHMSMDAVLAMLAANDLTQVEAIHLLHLSDDNSDASMMASAIEAATGKLVKVADA